MLNSQSVKSIVHSKKRKWCNSLTLMFQTCMTCFQFTAALLYNPSNTLLKVLSRSKTGLQCKQMRFDSYSGEQWLVFQSVPHTKIHGFKRLALNSKSHREALFWCFFANFGICPGPGYCIFSLYPMEKHKHSAKYYMFHGRKNNIKERTWVFLLINTFLSSKGKSAVKTYMLLLKLPVSNKWQFFWTYV